jgi:hypothetical protein
MVTPARLEADLVEGCPTGFVVRIYDEEGTDPGITDVAAVWTTYWELTWNAVPGAVDYLLYYATAEGMSLKPRQSAKPTLRLSVARGIGAVADRDALGWKAQLGMMAAQLQVIVVARFADGSVGPASRRFSVGETVTIQYPTFSA